MTPIKYIGKRPTYRDGAYGSGLVFTQGETVNVEDDDLARKLLRHKDVYVAGDAEQASATVAAGSAKKDDGAEDDAQDARDAIANMNKAALVDYAKVHFKADLDKRMSVADMRTKVTGLYDQFGVE